MIIGNKEARDRAERLIKEGTVHAILLTGPTEVGKFSFAKSICELAMARKINEAGDSDFMAVAKAEDANQISISQIAAVNKMVANRPLSAKRSCIIIDGADKMTKEAANSMLISLEEPRGNSLMILTTDMLENVLPTIRSRCISISLTKVPNSEIKAGLLKMVEGLDDKSLDQVVKVAHGLPARAIKILQDKKVQTKLSRLAQDVETWVSGDTNTRLKIATIYGKDKALAKDLLYEMSLIDSIKARRGLNAANRRLNNNVSAKGVLEALAMLE